MLRLGRRPSFVWGTICVLLMLLQLLLLVLLLQVLRLHC